MDSLPALSVKLSCSSEGIFLREVAPRLRGRFWFPTELTPAIGDKVSLTVELEGSTRKLEGTARVTEVHTGRLCLRLVALSKDSMQFHLGGDGSYIDDVLLPGAFREKPHPFTEAPTPPKGIELVQSPEPEAAPPAAPAPVLVAAPPPPADSQWSGGLQPLDAIKNYQLLERLGVGGMAEVYAARALIGGVEKLVALKLVLPQFGPGEEHGHLFLTESRVAALLQHPGIIQVFDFGEASGRPFLAMEYVVGRDLTTLLHSGGALPPSFAVGVVTRVLQALEYLHARTDSSGEYLRLVHRDITPGNVLVSRFGEVKIVDFGVASVVDSKRVIAGKPAYMCPDQAAGRTPTPSWDVFAAGVVLRELLGEQVAQAPFEAVVQKATHPANDQRYPTAAAMREALEGCGVGAATPEQLGDVVRERCGPQLEAEQKRVGEATVKARVARPGTPGPLNQLWRAAARTRPGRALAAAPPEVRRGTLVAAGVLAALCGGLIVKSVASAHALNVQLQQLDERMRAGALSGPGDTALAALAQARKLDAADPRVDARAKELGRVFELLGDTAMKRGNDAEAAVHYGSLGIADPGRPGLVQKLIAAHRAR